MTRLSLQSLRSLLHLSISFHPTWMPTTTHSDSKPARSGVGDVELTTDSMPTMRSPLPANYFGDVQVSPTMKQQYRDIVQCRVNAMLADEHRYAERRAQQQPVVQETEWKFFRRMGDIKVYQRRLRGRSKQEVAAEEDFPEAAIAVERGNPSMVVDGGVTGTIEDMLYGVSATTQEEMITGLAYTAPPQDAVLLNVLERSTVEDSLHSAELLWVLTKFPILNPRDVCFLKATGVGVDGRGKPYGYMVLHSVDIPECPPFDYRKTKVLRAKMFFSFLFRETTPGYVDVMGRGVFDLAGGELLKLVLPHATSTVIDGLLRGVSCGEAKKLTLLALRTRDERRQVKVLSKHSVCSMCIRGKKSMLSSVRLRSCDVCGVPICKNCNVKGKRMFVGSKQPIREVVCCQFCAQQAKCITGVRLGDPEFVVVADYYRKKRRSTSSPLSSSYSAAAPTLSTSSVLAVDRRTNLDAATQNGDHEKLETKVTVSDASNVASSLGVMTNSTVDDSCAGLDFDACYSGALSDLNSGEYQVESHPYANAYDETEEEPEPGYAVSAELLKEYAELSHTPQSTTSSGVRPWNENYGVASDDFTKHNFGMNTASFKRRPNSMLEWMMELQSSAEVAYHTAKANEEIMKKSMR